MTSAEPHLPQLDLARLEPGALLSTLRTSGAALLHLGDARAEQAEATLAAARAFFAQSREAKEALAITGSPHFRGYSVMQNTRDFREQLHLGPARAAVDGATGWRRLEGPNRWPADTGWRATLETYAAMVAELGAEVLALLARAWGIEAAQALPTGPDGYRLLKLIGYHPQVDASAPPRSGVAAHVDFSWLTLTLQDGPGLEVCTPTGAWIEVEPRPGTIALHLGELLEFVSRGALHATPHRVVNPSLARLRTSIPHFVNPPLAATVRRLDPFDTAPRAVPVDAAHVHRALRRDDPRTSFGFGAMEWRRKGENRWCVDCTAD